MPSAGIFSGAAGIGDSRRRVEMLEAQERQHIQRVLAAVEGNRSEAARRLGISRSTLTPKLAVWSRSES